MRELLDVVDNRDHVTGTILRDDIWQLFKATGKNVRYANCFVQNAKGMFWVPRRTAHKKIAPNGLDFAASEHVKSGERYLAAITRGMSEELGLKAVPSKLQEIGKLEPAADRPYFSMIYRYVLESVPPYNPEDFTGYQWLTPNQLLRLLESGELAKQDLLPALRLLMLHGKQT